MENFSWKKKKMFFLISTQNIEYGYSLEAPHRIIFDCPPKNTFYWTATHHNNKLPFIGLRFRNRILGIGQSKMIFWFIMQTRLFNIIEFLRLKIYKNLDKKWYFCPKCRLWVLVLTSTHNLCFRTVIRKIMYIPAHPTFPVKSGVYRGIHRIYLSWW